MRYGQDWLRAAGVGAIVVLAVGGTSPARAQSCAVCKTTSLLLPLSGVFFIPGNPVIPAGENVSLIGKVHVVTHVTAVVGGNFLTDIYLNMAGVKGVGQTTGNMYVGTGGPINSWALPSHRIQSSPLRPFGPPSSSSLPTGAAACRCP